MSKIHRIWVQSVRAYLNTLDLGRHRSYILDFHREIAEKGEVVREGPDYDIRPLVRWQAAQEAAMKLAVQGCGRHAAGVHGITVPSPPTPYCQPIEGDNQGLPTKSGESFTLRGSRVGALHSQILDPGRIRFWAIHAGGPRGEKAETKNYERCLNVMCGDLWEAVLRMEYVDFPRRHIGQFMVLGNPGSASSSGFVMSFEQIGQPPCQKVRFHASWDQLKNQSPAKIRLVQRLDFLRRNMRPHDLAQLEEHIDAASRFLHRR